MGCRGRGRKTRISLSGIIDEVTLYDRPLTGGEVLAIANAGAAGKCKP